MPQRGCEASLLSRGWSLQLSPGARHDRLDHVERQTAGVGNLRRGLVLVHLRLRDDPLDDLRVMRRGVRAVRFLVAHGLWRNRSYLLAGAQLRYWLRRSLRLAFRVR